MSQHRARRGLDLSVLVMVLITVAVLTLIGWALVDSGETTTQSCYDANVESTWC